MVKRIFSDAIDSRFVFRCYAVASWVVGIGLYCWPPAPLQAPIPGFPHARWVVVRVVGAALVAVGCLAHASSFVEDPGVRRRALGWWAVGHAVAFVGLLIQTVAVFGEPGAGPRIALGWLLTASVLFGYFNQSADLLPVGGLPNHQPLLGEADGEAVRRLRSTYEEQIRLAASQEERNRLARDLHDSVKQQIFAIQTAAATAQTRFAVDPEGAHEAIARVRESARAAMTEMEVMLDQLRASPIENAGLVAALRKECDALGFRTGAEVRFTLGDLPPTHSLPPGAHQVVFRIAQEALANVARHARASHVTVTLDSTDWSLQLLVQDDGVGFDDAHIASGMGLGNIRTRAAAVGGTLALTTRPGRGTLVRLSIPRASPDTDEIGYYRRRTVSLAVGFTTVLAFTIWTATWSEGWLWIFLVPQSAVCGVVLARATTAYVRVKREVERR